MNDHTAENDARLTASEITDLTQAWAWWRSNGDPEVFYDMLNKVVARRVIPPGSGDGAA